MYCGHLITTVLLKLSDNASYKMYISFLDLTLLLSNIILLNMLIKSSLLIVIPIVVI